MYVLLALSVLGLALVIKKYSEIFRINSLHKKLADKLNKAANLERMYAASGEIGQTTPLGVVIDKIKTLQNEEFAVIQESIETTANLAIHKLEKGLGWISTISAVAPLVGFLGTVTGMVRVFINIASHSQEGINITLLAGGIWEALLTTVGGLIVGIPAIIFYNDLVAHAENTAKFLQEQIDLITIKLHQQKQ